MFRLQRIFNSCLKPIAKSFATLRIPKPTLMLNSSNIYKLNHKKKKRVGRGLLSTAGRGRKGFKHRHGKQRVYRGYEGGQSTFVKKMPKLGPQTKSKKPLLRPLYLDKLQQWIKLNRLGTKISIQDICTSGVAGKVKYGVVLIAKVTLIKSGRRILYGKD